MGWPTVKVIICLLFQSSLKTAVAVCHPLALPVCARQMDVKTLAQLYIYEKLRWISYKCVYICVCPYWIWVALVTPLFEATDRPGVPVLCSSSYDGGVRIDNDKVNRMEIGQSYIQKTWNIEVYHICRITRSNKLVVKPEQFAFPMILLNLLCSPYKHVGK